MSAAIDFMKEEEEVGLGDFFLSFFHPDTYSVCVYMLYSSLTHQWSPLLQRMSPHTIVGDTGPPWTGGYKGIPDTTETLEVVALCEEARPPFHHFSDL